MSFSAYQSLAQVSTYEFAQTTGTFTSISADGDIVPESEATTSSTKDTAGWPVALPFDFNFDGNNYSSIYVNSNGAASFGANSTSSTLISTKIGRASCRER